MANELLGWKDIFLLGGRGLLFLAVLTLIVLVTAPWFTSRASSQVCLTGHFADCPFRSTDVSMLTAFSHRTVSGEEKHLETQAQVKALTSLQGSWVGPVTEDENKRRQKRAREQQQETLRSQSSEYLEKVLKPRQEMKLRKQQEDFYQMMGESWKSLDGHKLGGQEPRLAQEDGAPGDSPNKEASKRRKLPEPMTCRSASAEQRPRVKKVLVLPEEPPETAKEVVAVALRCPDGRVFRRRFYKLCSSQVLLDWMMKVGYQRSIYTLSTSYPRRPLEVGEDQTLEDAGLTTDTVLNVEEKEPCPSL
ncbi:UBX domain-containing protein 8 isoform X3 [Macrotis lagotis]|uniref:UBX domain-containing protein 8 isoform X3 n=1 Tax=Macrotis lagotis TaxID=92651 RepID=UPI003D695A0E